MEGQENKTVEEPVNEQKSFTQDEVNAIIGERLAKEKAKYTDYEALREKAQRLDEIEEANKTELQKATEENESLKAKVAEYEKEKELRMIRDNVAKETGVPADLLTADTEEACKAQAQAIIEYAKPNGYPQVRDGGEVLNKGGKLSTKQQFAQWAENAFGG